MRLPQDLQRAMAAEAEASREARAKVIKNEHFHEIEEKREKFNNNKVLNCRVEVKTCQVIAAEGEQKASKALKEASDIITESAAALQLR